MAVTAIWPIKGRVGKVIDYARNPEKVHESSYEEQAALHAIDGVVEYAANEMKTEERAFVSCLNCREDAAAAQFMETKRLWGKMGGRTCYHGYQSFKADEVTAEMAHEIGVKLAQELWGDRFEVVVATHCNTGHYHNHFVVNSVSFADGYKFYNSKADYAQIRQVSDRLCREYGISVIEKPKGKSKHYAEWQAEQNGKPTYRGIIRADIDRAILASTTERDFIRVMQAMGYEFKTRGKKGQPLKRPGLRPPDSDDFFRFYKLGKGYDLDEIKERILRNIHKQVPFPEAERRPNQHYHVRGKSRRKITGLRALYFRYCHELHIIVKHPASVKRVSFLLREDVIKLDRLDAQTRFLGKSKIETLDQLIAHKDRNISEMEALSTQRKCLRNQLKQLIRQGDVPATDAVKAQIADISSNLRVLRKEVVLCDEIAQRSSKVKENLERLMKQKETERKELTQDELLRRRGRTSHAHELRDG